MAVTKDDVRHVASLARLAFSEEEVEELAGEMSEILGFFESLAGVDTAGVEPAFRALRRENVARDDAVGEMLTPDDALANAPDREGNYFRVPGILPKE